MEMPKAGVSGAVDSGAYTDLNRLSSLKVGDRDSEANLRKVAQEFESLFLGEMLKSMRSANNVLAKDNPLNTETTKQYQDMYDQQLSVTLSKQGGGIGLQDVLMRQLSKTKSTAHTGGNPFGRVDPTQKQLGASHVAAADSSAAQAGGSGRNDMALMNQRRLSLPSKLTDRLMAGITPTQGGEQTSLAAAAKNRIQVPATAPSSTDDVVKGEWAAAQAYAAPDGNNFARSIAQVPLSPAKRVFASSDEFIATMLPMAEKAAARIGVDPKVLVAQAALETGWGKSIMRADDGSNSHNLFGIKATGNWQGEQARAITSEFRDGQMVKETADFRSYSSYEDSFHDLVSLLQNNDRYQGVVKSADNPEQFVKELQKAGYATDPNYASKISAIAKQMQGIENFARNGSTTTNL